MDENPRAKRRKTSSDHENTLASLADDVASIKSELHEALDEIQASRAEVKEIVKIKNVKEIPIPLQQALNESLKCKICMGIAKPPAIFGKCCQQLLGCQRCIDTWFSGNPLDKTCINCRAERAVAQTCHLRGMDGLLNLASSVLEEQQPTTEDEDEDL